MKRYDLMQAVNGRATFLVSKLCLPHLLKSANPHILTLAPPINLDPRWFAPHLAYTMSKYSMSLVTLGQGVPFFQAGDDMLRSKDMDQNSYDSGDWFNKIDWSGATARWWQRWR